MRSLLSTKEMIEMGFLDFLDVFLEYIRKERDKEQIKSGRE